MGIHVPMEEMEELDEDEEIEGEEDLDLSNADMGQLSMEIEKERLETVYLLLKLHTQFAPFSVCLLIFFNLKFAFVVLVNISFICMSVI